MLLPYLNCRRHVFEVNTVCLIVCFPASSAGLHIIHCSGVAEAKVELFCNSVKPVSTKIVTILERVFAESNGKVVNDTSYKFYRKRSRVYFHNFKSRGSLVTYLGKHFRKLVYIFCRSFVYFSYTGKIVCDGGKKKTKREPD